MCIEYQHHAQSIFFSLSVLATNHLSGPLWKQVYCGARGVHTWVVIVEFWSIFIVCFFKVHWLSLYCNNIINRWQPKMQILLHVARFLNFSVQLCYCTCLLLWTRETCACTCARCAAVLLFSHVALCAYVKQGAILLISLAAQSQNYVCSSSYCMPCA